MIDRKTFVDLFNKYNLDELLYDVVDGKKFTELEHFLVYYDVDFEQVNIIGRGSPLLIISWYKHMHPGRCLEIRGVASKLHLKLILQELRKDIKLYKEYNEENGNKL